MKLRDPDTAQNLAELCEILNEWAEKIADTDNEIDDYNSDLTSLPTFGGPNVDDTTEVWSWDAEDILVNGDQITVSVSGWTTSPRCPACGEAPFHCHHDAGVEREAAQ